MSQQLEGLVDVPQLETFLRARLPPQDGDLVVEKHEAGFSNETFYVSWGPKRWVLRRPPRGDILPTAHDMLREFRVLSGLAPTGVRVPQPAVACDDLSIIGAPFYLMERVEGIDAGLNRLPAQHVALLERPVADDLLVREDFVSAD